MKFIADENFPLPSVRLLRDAGHDVVAVMLESPGIPDESVLERAFREERILLTFDRDFGGLLYERSSRSPGGLVYFRFIPASPEEPGEHLLRLIENFEAELSGMFTVAERDRVRQRPLPGEGRK